jgi:hypothetical protein
LPSLGGRHFKKEKNYETFGKIQTKAENFSSQEASNGNATIFPVQQNIGYSIK